VYVLTILFRLFSFLFGEIFQLINSIFLFQLSVQLMALGGQSPGLWQSQLAAAAVRQMSNSNLGNNSQPPNLYPQNEIQVKSKF
jgi:hypothetical protein